MMVYTGGHFIIVEDDEREKYHAAINARDKLLSLVNDLQGTCQHLQRSIRSGVDIAPLISQARHQIDQININKH